jgi:xanthine dehydrogenase accessory factor
MNAPLLLDPPVYADYVLDALRDWRRDGHRTALLTLIEIDGSAPRPKGSQMAVCADGRSVGAISGGCVERTLVLDAMAAMARGANHIERYGKGSRFKDIDLPCGSGICVHFDVTFADADLDRLMEARHRRIPAWLVIDEASGQASASQVSAAESDGIHVIPFLPQCRLVLAGQGPIAVSCAHLARMMEMRVEVHSTDRQVHSALRGQFPLHDLKGAADFAAELDAWTAVVTTFHDHSFEADILAAALRSDAFFIGALGSQRTHARRLETLRAMGCRDGDLARIQGPVGLDLGARTPPEIALAIVAQIVTSWRGRAR